MAEHLWHYPCDGESTKPGVIDLGTVKNNISKSEFRNLPYKEAKTQLLKYRNSKRIFEDIGECYIIAQPCKRCKTWPREEGSVYCELCPIAIEIEQFYPPK
jgi:hypothetical protein